MQDAFGDALVVGWEGLLAGIPLPDPDDGHVVAAGIRGGAQAIVTANLTGFPAAALGPLGLLAIHPDDFLLDQLDLSPPPFRAVTLPAGAIAADSFTSAHIRLSNGPAPALAVPCR